MIGYIPERVAIIRTLMLEDGRLRKFDDWTTGPKWLVPEGRQGEV